MKATFWLPPLLIPNKPKPGHHKQVGKEELCTGGGARALSHRCSWTCRPQGSLSGVPSTPAGSDC